jgi:hypothetical protein
VEVAVRAWAPIIGPTAGALSLLYVEHAGLALPVDEVAWAVGVAPPVVVRTAERMLRMRRWDVEVHGGDAVVWVPAVWPVPVLAFKHPSRVPSWFTPLLQPS